MILSTVRDAHDRDYRMVVLADACADLGDFLMERMLPRQAEVTEVAALAALLG